MNNRNVNNRNVNNQNERTDSSSRRRRGSVVVAVAGVGVALASLAVVGASRASADVPFARATLRDANGRTVGRVSFISGGRRTVVQVRLNANANVTAEQFHGFHIHTGSDAATVTSGCQADPAKAPNTWFVSAGGHLKDDGQLHSQHNGDLQSLLVNRDGSASSTFTTDRFAAGDLAGRAIILHAGADNFANVPVGAAPDQYSANSAAAVTKTQNTGNAGDRVACGVIRVGGGSHGERDD